MSDNTKVCLAAAVAAGCAAALMAMGDLCLGSCFMLLAIFMLLI